MRQHNTEVDTDKVATGVTSVNKSMIMVPTVVPRLASKLN